MVEHMNGFQEITNQMCNLEILVRDELKARRKTSMVALSNLAVDGNLSTNIMKESLFNG